jgi:hyperosmotically inducible periplasmic protein
MFASRRVAQSLLILSLVAGPLIACGGGGGGAVRPVGQSLDDATITTRVKTALLNDPDVGAQQIDVSASAGVVTLNGVVKTEAEIPKAIELAKKVGGVKDVQSNLKVQP